MFCKKKCSAAACLLLAVFASGARADDDGTIAQLQARVKALEDAQSSSRSKLLNPDLSLILTGNYVHESRDHGDWLRGFLGSDHETPSRGFSLGESELVASASIDPYLRGFFVLSVPTDRDESPQVEEGFIETLGLGAGLTLKAGRFLSGLGYLNSHHAHTWDFNDVPMIYQGMFGGPLSQDGVQLRYLAPTPFLLELGAEAGASRQFPADGHARNGLGLGVLSLHAGDDIGTAWSWRSGLSWIRTSPRDRSSTDPLDKDMTYHFSGRSNIVGVDGVFKHQSGSMLQGEYFWGRESGELDGTEYRARPRGGYIQAVLSDMTLTRWRVGLRYENLQGAGGGVGRPLVLQSATLNGWGLMTDFSPSEFSRVRLQYVRRNMGADDNGPRHSGQWWLQYTVSLGAHGAHQY